MKASIVIRTKNEEDWLKACLLSIKNQDVKEVEVVLVDNRSSDKTVDVALYHGVKKIVRIEEYLPGDALNRGAAECSGEVVVFLSAHCIPANSSWLANLIQPVIEGTSVASYGRQIPTPASDPENARDLLMFFGADSVLQTTDCRFHNANSCIKRSYFEKFKFDPKITNVEDWYWAKRAIESGEKIAYQANASVFHHHGVNQHNSGSSFRSKPVAELLTKLQLPAVGYPQFMKPSEWEGLVLVSCANRKSLDLVKKIYELNDKNLKFDVGATGELDNQVFSIDKAIPFQKYLQVALSHFEKESNKIYDYLVLVDDHYAELDLSLIELNVRSLFKNWVGVSTAAREIKGWLFSSNDNKKSLTRCELNETATIEALQGQGSAMRTSVVRLGALDTAKVYISSIVERRFAFKRG